MKYSQEKAQQIAHRLEQEGGHVSNTCKVFNISRKTFYEWVKKYDYFAELVEDALAVSTDNVESALYRNALEGNATAQIFWLVNRRNDRWKNVNRHEHTGPEGGPVSVNWSNVPLEKRKEMMRIIKENAASE